jgi:ArsR family transcriptional regulator
MSMDGSIDKYRWSANIEEMRIELAMRRGDVERFKGCCGPVPAGLEASAAAAIANTMKALGDPARVQILHMLASADAPICVCDFTAALDLGQATISHHLAKLKAAGFIDVEKQGIWSFYQLRRDLDGPAQAALKALSG